MQTVGRALLSAGVKDMMLCGVEVGIELIVRDLRHRDDDNYAAISKPILDSLVRMGVLVDDRQDCVLLQRVLVTVNPARAPRTIIRVWQPEQEAR